MSNGLLGLFNKNELLELEHYLLTSECHNEMTLIKEIFKILERPKPDFYNPLDLFHGHFILFNGLHRLNNQVNNDYYIFIELTNIKLIKKEDLLEATIFQIQENDDKLVQYYLNDTNFHQASKEKIDNMLNEFTLKFKIYLENHNNESIQEENDWQKLSIKYHSIENKLDKNFKELELKYSQLNKYLE